MGYYAQTRSSKVKILRKDLEQAYLDNTQFAEYVHSYLVRAEDSPGIKTFISRLADKVTLDSSGNVVDLQYNDNKVGWQYELFDLMAPLMREGDFLEFVGEDGAIFRFIVHNGEIVHQEAIATLVEYPELPSIQKRRARKA